MRQEPEAQEFISTKTIPFGFENEDSKNAHRGEPVGRGQGIRQSAEQTAGKRYPCAGR